MDEVRRIKDECGGAKPVSQTGDTRLPNLRKLRSLRVQVALLQTSAPPNES